jgi:hypothetical protein
MVDERDKCEKKYKRKFPGRLSSVRAGSRLAGVTGSKNKCCKEHGFFSPHQVEWGDGGPCCPHCHKKIVAIKDCPVHGHISFKDIKWIDNKPYCPNCFNFSLEDK